MKNCIVGVLALLTLTVSAAEDLFQAVRALRAGMAPQRRGL